MKHLSLLLIVLSLSLTINSFSQDKAWFTSSSEAKVYAQENKVPILLVFAGSDWCKPCMMLKKEILLSKEFQEYFPSHFALLYLDFPMQAKNQLPEALKKQNELLAGKYNKSGFFPNLVLIDTGGKIQGTLTFKNQTAQVFIQQCEDLLHPKH